MSCRRSELGLALLLVSTSAAAQTRVNLTLEAGGEYDSNATRVPDADAPVGSGVYRMTAGLGVASRLGDRHALTLYETVGGKVFFANDAQTENVFVTDTHLLWSAAATRAVAVQMAADYYDAFQQASLDRRDFRLGSLGPRVVLAADADTQVTGMAGYRAFQYKLDDTEDYWGPFFGAGARRRWITGPEEDEREWDLELVYQLNARTFNGYNFENDPSTLIKPTTSTRNDLFHSGELRLTWTGPILLGLGYGIEWNDSTSYGFGWLRHIVTARFAAQLPGEVHLAVRAVLQILSLSDPVLLDPRASMNDTFEAENRSSLEIGLDREIGRGVRAVVRYSYFTSALGTVQANVPAAMTDYSRQLAFLGVAYRFDQ